MRARACIHPVTAIVAGHEKGRPPATPCALCGYFASQDPRKNDDLRRRKGKKANDLRRHTLCVAILRRRSPGKMMTCDAEKAKRPTTSYGRGQKADDLRRKGLGHGARRDGGVNWGLTAQRGRRYWLGSDGTERTALLAGGWWRGGQGALALVRGIPYFCSAFAAFCDAYAAVYRLFSTH